MTIRVICDDLYILPHISCIVAGQVDLNAPFMGRLVCFNSPSEMSSGSSARSSVTSPEGIVVGPEECVDWVIQGFLFGKT